MTKSEELKARLREQTVVSQPTTEPTMSKSQMLKQQLVQQMQPQQVQQPVQQVTTQPVATQPTNTQYGAGNIDLTKRPVVKNDDGSISTVRSMSFNEDGKEILVPTVVNGRVVSDQEAIDHYHKTGEYLGKFNTVDEANAYAENLHNQQEKLYGHSVKAQQGLQQAQDRLHATETKGTPMTDKLNAGGTLTPEEVIQLAREQGRITDKEAQYRLELENAKNKPTVNTYANPENYEKVKPTTKVAQRQGEKEAQEELATINNDNIATKYIETKDKLATAKATKDTRQIAKNEAILKGIKQGYNAEKRDVDVVQSRKDYEAWGETVAHDLANYNNATTPEQKQIFAQTFLRDKEAYDQAYRQYAEDLTYDEIKNNNIAKDSASSFGKNVLGGTANIINGAYTAGTRLAGLDATSINADSLLKFNNGEQFNATDVTNIASGLNPITGIVNNVTGLGEGPASSFAKLTQLRVLNPYNKRLENLYNQIANKTYNGTKQQLANELDAIQKEIYQNFKDVYTQDELDAVADQLRHNEIYGDLAAIPNAFGTTGNMVPSILLGTATGGLGEALGGGSMAAAGTVANTAQQIGSMGSLGLGAYSQGMDEALQNGATWNQAQVYGALSGATEVGTEMLGGESVNRFLGQTGKSALGKVFGKAIDNLNIESKVGRIVANTISDVAGESTEEMISEALNPLWKAITYDPNALPQNADEMGEYFKNILKAGAEAIPSTLLMQGAGVAGNVVKTQQVENGIIKSINESDLSQIVKNQLINEVRKASTDVKLGLEEADYMKDRAYEKGFNLVAQSEQMKQRIPEGYSLPQSTIDILAYTENNRPGLNIAFDTNIQGNGTFVENPDGTRTITLNPNSKRAVEFTLTHELGHDLKGTQEYTQLQNLLTDYAKGKPGYQESLKQLDKTYRESGASYNLQDEATNDMLGQAIGEQEFYNKLAENPTLFNRVTNGLKNLLGNKDTKLKNKIEKLTSNALKQEYKGNDNQVRSSLSSEDNTQQLNDYLTNSGFQLDTSGRLSHTNELTPKQIKSLASIYKKYGYEDVSQDYLKNALATNKDLKIPREVADAFIEKELGYKPQYDTTKIFEDAEGNPLTKEQVEFYKNSGVRDIRGRLIPVYHRTNADFTVFDKKAGKQHGSKYGGGFYFSITPENYGNNTMKVYLNAADGEFKYIPSKGYYVVQEPNQIKNIDNKKPTENPDINLSKSNQSWQQFLDNIYGKWNTGTRTNFEGLPSNEELQQAENKGVNAILKDLKIPTNEELQQTETKSVENEPIAKMTTDKSLEDMRSFKKVGDRKVNAYQYDNPEVKPFFQHEAENMLMDLRNVIKGERTATWDDYGTLRYTGTTREATQDIVDLLDGNNGVKLSYDDIRKGLEAIIKDKGSENIAAAKRIEMVLDKRLRDGYTDSYGTTYEANENYLNFLEGKDYIDPAEYERQRAEEMIAQENENDTLFSLNEEQQKEVTDYINKINEDTTLDDNFKDQILNKFDNLNNYKQFEDIKQEVDDYNKKRSWTKTAKKNELVNEFLDVKDMTYVPESNKKQLKYAKSQIDRLGYDEAIKFIDNKINMNERFNANDIAMGELLIQEAIKNGDYDKAQDLISDVAIIGTELGQAVQALSLIERMTPEGQLKYLNKVMNKINENIDKKNTRRSEEKQIPNITLDKETSANILKATNEVELQQAMDTALQKIADQMQVSFSDKVAEWRYLAMLANPRTHFRNILANVAMRGTYETKNAVQRAIETIASPLLKERTRTFKKATSDVKKFAEQSTKDNANRLSGNKERGIESRLKELQKVFKTAPLEKLRRLNSDWLSKEDNAFTNNAYKQNLAEYLTANGIKTQHDIDMNPEIVQKGINYATQEAWKTTFHQASKLANALSNIENSSAFAKLFVGGSVPFKKTPINIAKTGASYSPLGLFETLGYETYKLKKGDITANEFIDRLSQGFTGSALFGIGALLAKFGILKAGADDEDYEESIGKTKEYSIRLGDKNFDISWLAPSGIPLLMGAELVGASKDGETNINALLQSLEKSINPLSEMSLLQGVNSTLQSYSNQGIGGQIGSVVENAFKSYFGQFLPTIGGQVNKIIDDTQRVTTASKNSKWRAGESFARQQLNKIPGGSFLLEPKTDVWGREVKRDSNPAIRAFDALINPGTVTKDNSSRVDDEILAVFSKTGEDVKPTIPKAEFTYNGEKIKLSAKDYTKYKKTVGQYMYDTYDALLDSEAYKSLREVDRAKILEKIAKDSINLGKAAVGTKTQDYTKYDVIKDELDKAGIPLADYYLFASDINGNTKKSTKQTIIKQRMDLLNEMNGKDTISKEDKSVLYDIFGVN